MKLVEAPTVEMRQSIEMTILRHGNGTWNQSEIDQLNKLGIKTSQHPDHPGYVILQGHHGKKTTLKTFKCKKSYTVLQITGTQSSELPFIPGFI